MLKVSIYVFLSLFHTILYTAGSEAQKAQEHSDKTAEIKTSKSHQGKYQIIRTHLPTKLRGPQASVSRGIYVANFGSREGIQPGSIFHAIHNGNLMGILYANHVGKDTTGLSIIRLIRKKNIASSAAIEVGYILQPEHVLLETIYFNAGDLNLTPKIHERLRMSIRFISSFPSIPLIIEGHTDAIGDPKNNLILSEKRAVEVSNYLNQVFRIPREQLHPIGYGETRPAEDNSTADGRYKNRRVNILLQSKSLEEINLTTSN